MKIRNALFLLAVLALSACSTAQKPGDRQAAAPIVDAASGPSANAAPAAGTVAAVAGSGGYLAGDGPGADAPANLDAIPDAVPKAEPLHRYANRPYSALGKTYTPLAEPGNYREHGIASWYGKKFHGQRTSIGETYDMYAMTAAHPTLPIPSYARVTNPANGRSVIVRVNDRGPFLHDRIMDLSYAAAYKLDIIGSGSAEVEVESILPGQETVPVQKSPVQTANAQPSPQPIAAEPVQVETLRTEPAPPAIIPISTTPILPPARQGSPVAAPENMDASGGVFLQLGSFRSTQGAQSFVANIRHKLGDLGKQIRIYTHGGLTRVRLGPFRTAEDARASAEQLEPRLGFKPFVSPN